MWLELGRWLAGPCMKKQCPTTVQLTKQQGLGIALVAARNAQVAVTLVDSSQASLDKGLRLAGERPVLRLTRRATGRAGR